MGWNRDTLEQCLLADYNSAGQSEDFTLTVPDANVMSAVLMQLKHLKTSGRITGFDRRAAQEAEEKDNVVYIYGYTPLP